MQESEHDSIVLSPPGLRRVLVAATALVSLAGLTVEVLRLIYRWKERSDVVALLSLSHEQNVPTYYTAVLLLLAASMSALLAAHARRATAHRRDAIAWWGLSAGFLYISLDEVLELHEQWGRPFQMGGGVLLFSWVIPAACIVLALLLLYARFLLRLPPRARNRLILAGGVYVFGAVVMELPLGYWADREGQKNLGYALIDWAEETLEMAGLVLFLAAASDMLAAAKVALRFGAPAPAGDGPEPPEDSAHSEEPARDDP